MHHYPHHIGDYRSHTAHLSNDEDLAYRRLLEMYYDTEQPIPLDTQWVSRRLRVGLPSIEVVLNDFFEKSESGWISKRCEQEIAEYRKIAERNRINGAKGGRRKNPVGSQSPPRATPGPSQPITNNQEPITNNQFEDQKTFAEAGKPASAPKREKATFNYSTGQIENLSQEVVLAWQEAYPAIDIRSEIAKAKAWLLANPKNKKSSIERFLNNWLCKAQDHAPRANHENGRSTYQQQDNSAAGRVRAAVAAARAARGEGDRPAMDVDGLNVRPPLGEQLRGSSGPGQSMGLLLEGDYTRAD